ncbi:alpha/beta hydrolase (plasmid) [Kitasatospora sp. NBC_00070]|uniref:alpha/beta fold hydrolase n=1 Tax=Kitasatospora sp. NBC_00070 TaxID=2975962 RepID=UPI00324E8BCC
MENVKIDLDGHSFDALAAGAKSGELVLLLHGFPEFSAIWDNELDSLAKAGFRALAVDQRGYSPSARPAAIEDYSIENMVSDSLGFADSQGADRFHLIAHDWGAMVAWALASAHPERILSINILSTPHPLALQNALKAGPEQHKMLSHVPFLRQRNGVPEAALASDGGARIRQGYAGRMPRYLEDEIVRRLLEPGALAATLNWYRAIDEDLSVPAGRIAVPTLYIWGDEDSAYGRKAAEDTARFIDAPYHFEILEGAGHWLPHESSETINKLLLSHVRENSENQLK